MALVGLSIAEGCADPHQTAGAIQQSFTAAPATATPTAEVGDPRALADAGSTDAGSTDAGSTEPPDAGLDFPEDHLPVHAFPCPGGCPDVFQRALSEKDRKQMHARILHCTEGRAVEGGISVDARISGKGVATKVSVTRSGDVPDDVIDCVRALVETAPFSSKYNVPRASSARVTPARGAKKK
jgi:hypothetical protein